MLANVLLTILVIYLLYKNVKRPDFYPPGPSFWPCVGNLISVWIKLRSLKYHHVVWQQYSRQFGNLLGLKLGSTNVVIVSGKDMIREVAIREVFDGRPDFFYKLRSFGKKIGIVFADGDSWFHTRKAVVKYLKKFGFDTQSMDRIINEECKDIVEYISGNLDVPLVANNLFDVSIVNVTWRFVAGKRYDLNDNNLKKLCVALKSLFKSLDMSGGILNFMPALRFIIPNLSGYNKINEIHNVLYSFISETIKEHKTSLDPNNPRDVIDAMLIEMAQQGEPFTEENIKTICLDLLEAGSETVNNTLIFLILYLVLNEEVQHRLRKEIHQVIGSTSSPSLSHKNRMKYTEAVITEALRLSSVAPLGIAHMATDNAPLGNYVIPKGTLVLLTLYDLHNGHHWDNPDTFQPERFLNKNSEIIQDDWLIPFGLGKRRCIGEGLARSELFLFTTHLLQKFHIVIPDGDPRPSIEPVNGISLSPQPFRVMFKLIG